jgi:hypothetical protein
VVPDDSIDPRRSSKAAQAGRFVLGTLGERAFGPGPPLRQTCLGEIDERRLYLDWSFASMFAFCVGELGFSEDVACNRINVARAARNMPVILDALRSGKVHLAGLRLLAPHLTADNEELVLAEAAGKSKRETEELVARLAPKPAAPTIVRKLPEPRNSAPEAPTFSFGIAIPPAPSELSPAPALAVPPPAPGRDERAMVAPLAEDAFKFQFTGSRACHDKFRQAQELLRHRIPHLRPRVPGSRALLVAPGDAPLCHP